MTQLESRLRKELADARRTIRLLTWVIVVLVVVGVVSDIYIMLGT